MTIAVNCKGLKSSLKTQTSCADSADALNAENMAECRAGWTEIQRQGQGSGRTTTDKKQDTLREKMSGCQIRAR